jgi:hypothetical protein
MSGRNGTRPGSEAVSPRDAADIEGDTTRRRRFAPDHPVPGTAELLNSIEQLRERQGW